MTTAMQSADSADSSARMRRRKEVSLVAVMSAELTKLKGSMVWTVVGILPVLVVLTSVVNTVLAGEAPENGWSTLWLRAAVVHGLFPLPVGIAALAALVWRPEHRGGNRAALCGLPLRLSKLVVAKTMTVALLAAVMQFIFWGFLVVVGIVTVGPDIAAVVKYALVSVIIVIASVPVAAFQSGAAMLMRSFAMPVLVGFVASGTATVLVMTKNPMVLFVLPHAVAVRATQVGTGVLADSGSITSVSILTLIVAAVTITCLTLLVSGRVIQRQDLSR